MQVLAAGDALELFNRVQTRCSFDQFRLRTLDVDFVAGRGHRFFGTALGFFSS